MTHGVRDTDCDAASARQLRLKDGVWKESVIFDNSLRA